MQPSPPPITKGSLHSNQEETGQQIHHTASVLVFRNYYFLPFWSFPAALAFLHIHINVLREHQSYIPGLERSGWSLLARSTVQNKDRTAVTWWSLWDWGCHTSDLPAFSQVSPAFPPGAQSLLQAITQHFCYTGEKICQDYSLSKDNSGYTLSSYDVLERKTANNNFAFWNIID